MPDLPQELRGIFQQSDRVCRSGHLKPYGQGKTEKIEESVALLRELNDRAPFITTPISELPGKKVLETMESGKSLEEELLDEIICPECGHHHEEGACCGHEHHHEHDHDHHHDHGHDHHHDHDHDHHHDHDHDHAHHHHHDHAGHHHADEVFTSWGRETVRKYTKEQIGGILKTLESDPAVRGCAPREGYGGRRGRRMDLF